MSEPTLTELAAGTGIKLAQVPFEAGIDAATKIIGILTGVDSGMDISGATKELQIRLDTLAGAMKNQSTQLKTGKTSAEFMELLAAAIQAANEVGSDIGPPLAAEAQKIIIRLFQFGKSTAADLIGLIPVVGEVFDVLRIINSVVSTGISSVDSFVTSGELLMDGFDDFVNKMSEELTESDSKLLTQESYNKLLDSDKFRKKFQDKFQGQQMPKSWNNLTKDQKEFVIKSLKAKTQLDVKLKNPETRSNLLQEYGKRRFDFHKKNTSNLMKTLKTPGNIVPLVTKKATSGLSEIHQNVSDAANEHYKSLQRKSRVRSLNRISGSDKKND